MRDQGAAAARLPRSRGAAGQFRLLAGAPPRGTGQLLSAAAGRLWVRVRRCTALWSSPLSTPPLADVLLNERPFAKGPMASSRPNHAGSAPEARVTVRTVGAAASPVADPAPCSRRPLRLRHPQEARVSAELPDGAFVDRGPSSATPSPPPRAPSSRTVGQAAASGQYVADVRSRGGRSSPRLPRWTARAVARPPPRLAVAHRSRTSGPAPFSTRRSAVSSARPRRQPSRQVRPQPHRFRLRRPARPASPAGPVAYVRSYQHTNADLPHPAVRAVRVAVHRKPGQVQRQQSLEESCTQSHS